VNINVDNIGTVDRIGRITWEHNTKVLGDYQNAAHAIAIRYMRQSTTPGYVYVDSVHNKIKVVYVRKPLLNTIIAPLVVEHAMREETRHSYSVSPRYGNTC